MKTLRTDTIQFDEQAVKAFALLVIQTADGQTLVRPIGGGWPNGINDTIEEMSAKYPGCKMKMYEENYGAWRKYFEPNGVPKDSVIIGVGTFIPEA